MRNERGITLVELLAALAIIGIIMVLLTTVFINGSKASNRNVSNQKLQQEANYIMETIRKEYLKLEGTDIELFIINNTLIMDGKEISKGFTYEFIGHEIVNSKEVIIDRNKSHRFEMKIIKDNLFYKIDTTLSKLH